MGQNRRNSGKIGATLTTSAAALVLLAVPALAQHATGHATVGSIGVGHSMSPGRSMGRPIGAPIQSGPRIGTIRPNTFGNSSAPPWELPRTVTSHWEIGPNVHVNPNPVQGNRIYRHNRARYGVGYVGLPYYGVPYYGDPLAFADAGFDYDDDTAEQAQPAPGPEDYGPQAPYGEGPGGPYDESYPPRRPPYNPEVGAPAPQNTAATQSDGLDHPAVTLVFSDGRPPEKVHSYVLTGSSIFVAEPGHQLSIPIADLDLPATIAQNREAGVDFQLPNGGK